LINVVGIIPRIELGVIEVMNLKILDGGFAASAFPAVTFKNLKPLFLPSGVTKFLRVGHGN
jgi:hypothetical protein